jgi:hypothetical protein
MSQTNVPVVLLDPGVNETASLPNVNLTTFAGCAVHAWSFQSQIIRHGPKETSSFPRQEAHRLDDVPGQHTADVIESCVDKWKKGDRSGLLWGGSDSLQWIESPSDLLELKLIMEAFMITQGSGTMYQCRKHNLFVRRVVVRVGMEIGWCVWV